MPLVYGEFRASLGAPYLGASIRDSGLHRHVNKPCADYRASFQNRQMHYRASQEHGESALLRGRSRVRPEHALILLLSLRAFLLSRNSPRNETIADKRGERRWIMIGTYVRCKPPGAKLLTKNDGCWRLAHVLVPSRSPVFQSLHLGSCVTYRLIDSTCSWPVA